MWLRHWGLARDPFAAIGDPYVSLPSHDEAVARLADAIERAEPLVTLFVPSGLGKTTVIRRALARSRNARRRLVAIRPPADPSLLVHRLAERLGRRVDPGSGPRTAWCSLDRALRATALEGSQCVLAIDDWDETADAAIIRGLAELPRDGRLLPRSSTVIVAGRSVGGWLADPGHSWTPGIHLDRLTRSQAELYLLAKLDAAGCDDRIFTPRGLARLHAWSCGVPGALERLAATCMAAGAAQGLEVIAPDVVDGVAERSGPSITPAQSAR